MRFVPLLLMLLAVAAHAELKVLDQPMWVFPGQTFRIALEQPPGSGELACEVPGALELFDHWDKDAIQRYYFRALAPGETSLQFSGGGGELSLAINVLPWAEVFEPREWEGLQLPRIWPVGQPEYAALKAERSLHSDAEIEALMESGAKPGGLAESWLDMTDEDVFNVVPGSCVPRTCLIVLRGAEEARGKGCPVCGTAIYEGRSGFYPWIYDAENHPWKVGCPECETWFPSNDFHLGDMHSGPFPDDGFGCEPVEPVRSESGKPWRFPFIAYYHEWQAYMRTQTPAIEQCAAAYITTGDERYAHKAAVGLFRWAESALDLSVNLNHRKMSVRDAILRGPVGAPDMNRAKRLGGSFLYIQPNWDTSRYEGLARAYDLIFEAIEGDEELLAFCQSQHHPEIESADDLRRFIEAGVHRVTAQAAMDNAVARNWPQQETMLTTMALALGTAEGLDIVDWLLNKGAGIRYSLTNQYFKDGSGHESEGYNGIQIRDMNRLILLLDKIAQRFPDEYQEPKFVSLAQDPKFRQVYLFPLHDSLIGRTYPSTGDTGSARPSNVVGRQEGFPIKPDSFIDIYRLTKDPRFARAMYGPTGTVPAGLDEDSRAEVERIGQEEGWQVATESDILDGYGHAILRSGEGDRQRALWMRYGRVTQHAHPDMLTIGFEALQRKLLPEMGYPVGWTYATNWETNWGTHYVTHIEGHRTSNFGRGEVTLFADAAPAHVARAKSEYLSGDDPPTREKTIALVDIDDRDCYAVVLETVIGGERHYWSFHGPDGDATAEGVELTPQGAGTMLGAEFEYKDDSSVAKTDPDRSCFAFMQDVARGNPKGTWSLDYLARGQDDVHLRMTSVHPTDATLATAQGRAPGGKSNYDITWAIAERGGAAPLTSQFLYAMEPYEGARRITGIEPVEVTGPSVGETQPLALRVTGEGFVDTIVFGPDPEGEYQTEDGLTCEGGFGFWRERDGRPTDVVLADGTGLRKGEVGVGLSVPRLRGTIENCDWGAFTVRVRFEQISQEAVVTTGEEGLRNVRLVGLSDGDASSLAGQHLRITAQDGTDASYLIQEAAWADGLVELTLATDPRIGEGYVASVDEGVINSGITMGLYRWGYYRGKTISNEDGSALFKLADVGKGRACQVLGEIPMATLENQFADLDGDGTPNFVIYDYGPGDEVEVKCWISVSEE